MLKRGCGVFGNVWFVPQLLFCISRHEDGDVLLTARNPLYDAEFKVGGDILTNTTFVNMVNVLKMQTEQNKT